MNALLTALQARHWIVRVGEPEPLPPIVASRYATLPAEVRSWVETLAVCHNAAEDIWFLTPSDYARETADSFRWNEIELMSARVSSQRSRTTGNCLLLGLSFSVPLRRPLRLRLSCATPLSRAVRCRRAWLCPRLRGDLDRRGLIRGVPVGLRARRPRPGPRVSVFALSLIRLRTIGSRGCIAKAVAPALRLLTHSIIGI